MNKSLRVLVTRSQKRIKEIKVAKSENNQIQNRSRREEEGWESLIPHIGLIPMLIPLGSANTQASQVPVGTRYS